MTPAYKVTCDMRGIMTVIVPVPEDVRPNLAGRATISRKCERGETVENAVAMLQAMIELARVPTPMLIQVEVVAMHDARTKDRIARAIITLMGALDLDDPEPVITITKPTR